MKNVSRQLLVHLFGPPFCKRYRPIRRKVTICNALPMKQETSVSVDCFVTNHIFFPGRKKNSKSECSLAEDSDVEAVMSVIRQNPESQSLEDLTRYSW